MFVCSGTKDKWNENINNTRQTLKKHFRIHFHFQFLNVCIKLAGDGSVCVCVCVLVNINKRNFLWEYSSILATHWLWLWRISTAIFGFSLLFAFLPKCKHTAKKLKCKSEQTKFSIHTKNDNEKTRCTLFQCNLYRVFNWNGHPFGIFIRSLSMFISAHSARWTVERSFVRLN